ncbi:uroporphyrinogen-III synthase [Fulvimarina manganoxydans]|uniref:Uroporphyrinogen-III synthase n=1 Tax=Fulvimarina manganoxydans TaxID=937218 RepID=A0A1W2EFT2_9HYPH|nr:uroporphyrinogen-III synthase [Fulvimarina manganoxydans]SMD08620.1 uroporphyrinogen-III synthase [Fulvimarina manganoxydans]
MARVVVVREAESARDTAKKLIGIGHEPLLLPLEVVVRLESAAPVGDWTGFVVTSAKAVERLAEVFSDDTRPVFAVGEASAEAARAVGLVHVIAGEGTATSLPSLVRSAFGATARPNLLYAAGRNRSGSLEKAFEACDIAFGIWEVYDIAPLMPDLAFAQSTLSRAPVDAVLILSRGQAEAYGRLVARLDEASLGWPLKAQPHLLCLSERIAAALPVDLTYRAKISTSPSLASLFEWIP